MIVLPKVNGHHLRLTVGKNVDVDSPSVNFSYSIVVGRIMYLSGHYWLAIAYAMNCTTQYMFCPRHLHDMLLKRIGCYLKSTRDRGLILNLSNALRVDFYPYADYVRMYGHEKPTDPSCVKSRTEFVITVSDCPVFWQSKLQTEIALQPWSHRLYLWHIVENNCSWYLA